MRKTLLAWWAKVVSFALIAFGAAGLPSGVLAQAPDELGSVDPTSLGWPRFFATNGLEFAVYQPQITAWPGNQLDGRFATAARPAGTSNETYGIIFFQARTEIDKVNRLVTLEDFQVTRVEFPTQRDEQSTYQAIFQSKLPQTARTVSLGQLEAEYAVSAQVEKVKIQPVLNDAPNIVYATQPTLLVEVDGAPVLNPLVGNYQRVVNTRAVLVYNTEPSNQGFYLFAASNWYSAFNLQGPWTVNPFPPSDINNALAAALATRQVDVAAPRSPLADPPAICLVTNATELLQTTGVANLLSIPGTDLLYVSNSDQPIFYYLDDGSYYVLISGRWFKSTALTGPWTFVPSASLPADFKNIPPDSAKSNVLLSVAGTPQAQAAVIASTIPQTATIYRDKATLTVNYIGAPSWVAIPGTTMFYAGNTTTPVVMLNPSSYYACQNGAWFVAASATGPWGIATSVPGVIYTIPTSCPIHYVTYSYVYGYTPSVVYVGYTPGYLGVVVAPGGTVVYGTGYVYPPVVIGATYVSYPPTYGWGASFALGAAAGFAVGYCIGHSSCCYYPPHWGCYAYPYPYHACAGYNVCAYNCYGHYGAACYNPYSGTAYRGGYANTYNPYTGTRGTVSGSASYNPWTGQGNRSASGSWYNPYSGASANGHANSSYNAYSGNWNGSSSMSGYNPSTGRSYSGSSSASGNAYTGNWSGSHSGSGWGQYGSYNNTTTASGNIYNHTASVSSSGSASYKGDTASWNNGTMTTEKNGDSYSYTRGESSANESTWQSAHSSSSWSGASHSGGWGGSSGGFADSHSWGGGGGGGWGGGGRSWGGRR